LSSLPSARARSSLEPFPSQQVCMIFFSFDLKILSIERQPWRLRLIVSDSSSPVHTHTAEIPASLQSIPLDRRRLPSLLGRRRVRVRSSHASSRRHGDVRLASNVCNSSFKVKGRAPPETLPSSRIEQPRSRLRCTLLRTVGEDPPLPISHLGPSVTPRDVIKDMRAHGQPA
jgi:hypothetical protein